MQNKLLLSSHYFPCVAYFVYLTKSKNITIDLGERFQKQTYRNRCHIYTSNGLLPLSVPVVKKNKTLMKDVSLATNDNWKATHWKAINSAYSSSPFFEFYCDELKKVFFKDYDKLTDLNTALLHHICAEIDLSISLNVSHSYIESDESILDTRELLQAKKNFKEAESYPRYIQTFESKHGFISNLSILDLLFHEGPETLNYLKGIALQV
jgi:hypothetical protein